MVSLMAFGGRSLPYLFRKKQTSPDPIKVPRGAAVVIFLISSCSKSSLAGRKVSALEPCNVLLSALPCAFLSSRAPYIHQLPLGSITKESPAFPFAHDRTSPATFQSGCPCLFFPTASTDPKDSNASPISGSAPIRMTLSSWRFTGFSSASMTPKGGSAG